LIVPSTFETWTTARNVDAAVGQELAATSRSSSAVLGHRDDPDVEPALVGGVAPRHEVGVVLHLGRQQHVARAQPPAYVRVGDEVDGLGRVLGEHDAPRVRVDELGDLATPALVEVGGLLGELVDAAVHVGARPLVVAVHGVEHDRGVCDDAAESR
jgi:hypothetical protein